MHRQGSRPLDEFLVKLGFFMLKKKNLIVGFLPYNSERFLDRKAVSDTFTQ